MPGGRPLRNERFLPYRRLRRQLGDGGLQRRERALPSPHHDVEDALVDRLIQDHLHPEDLLLNTRPDPNEGGLEPAEEEGS